MPDLHTEINFEDELVGHLTKHDDWLEGDPAHYNRELALFPEDVIGWIQDTEPAEYAKIKSANNDGVDRIILERLAKVIEEEGALVILRKGFKHRNARFEMCAFKPGHGLNPQTLEKYAKVRCRVVRQVHYSMHNANKSIDVVLFVNGIPVATLELKTENTQSIDDAVKQYKINRLPRDPQTGAPEPLLTFKRGALVYFAVSNDEIRMSTRLDGVNTVFLPFNLGNDGGEGNPLNPLGFRTAYFYERVLQRDAWLEIIEKYLQITRSTKNIDGKLQHTELLIFPRYHQWDAVRSLTGTVRAEGTGHNYLIQHSAGSGKSNTISWLAHQLASLHDASDKKVFDSIIVVTDRQILDDQLQATISQFEHKAGVVQRIKKEGSKSAQLTDALKNKTPIIIVTIQTFPYAIATIGELGDLAQRSFAVIADEAHSSQTGQAAKKLREALGIVDPDADEEAEVSAEDALLAQMAKRAGAKNISYFAFTATPKAKTIELFGRIGDDDKKQPFHVYTMQQAIEEGFILDVLRNYTTYDIAYRLATKDDKTGATIVPKSEAARLIRRYQKLHPYAIEQTVEIIVEHYRETVKPLLNERAKAMVVCDSRKAAVRYKLAIDKYIHSKKYDIATLVAFSGEVTDEVGGVKETYTEGGMNALKGESIPEAFDGNAYHVLLVAEKYQTGFDQPLLVAMYVGKKLANIAAVQTLSRLNRTYERDGVKKDQTFILDFVNKADDILNAFMPYYKTAELQEETDPDIIHDLQAKLDAVGIYTANDIAMYFEAHCKAQAVAKGEKRQSLLKAVLDPIVERYRMWVEKTKGDEDSEEIQRAEIFKANVADFVRAYGFLSQIFNYADTELEKRSIFLAGLTRLLKNDQDQIPLDVNGVRMTHFKSSISFKGAIDLKLGLGENASPLFPMKALGTAKPHEKEHGPLEEVVKIMNDVFGVGIDDEHQLVFAFETAKKLVADPTLEAQALNNSREQFKNAGDIIMIGQEKLVETKEEFIEKNDRENAALAEAISRLFGNKEGLEKLMDAMANYVYDYHNHPQT
jgi:type I restriction enzyme R subunit